MVRAEYNRRIEKKKKKKKNGSSYETHYFRFVRLNLRTVVGRTRGSVCFRRRSVVRRHLSGRSAKFRHDVRVRARYPPNRREEKVSSNVEIEKK